VEPDVDRPSSRRNSLADLIGGPVRREVAGVQLEIRPLTVRQLPRVLQLSGPFIYHLRTIASAEDAIALLGDHGAVVAELTAFAADLDPAELDAVTPDVMAEIFLAVLEINRDFFTPRIARLAARAQEVLGRLRADLAARGDPRMPAVSSATPTPSSA
jgi:hypothetical protein